ncbi:MAG: capsular biosynthesis protein, partial [Chloroflexi bacterium]|nr:capsular biosynthesis protein [Chloroflexota bacterium]
MIDLHSHILHDFDDGAQTLAAALEMARAAVADGVRVMAATPHGRSTVNAHHSRYSVALLQERLAELRATLAAAAIDLELVAGTELYGEPGVVERLRAGALLPYGVSQAVLVEFSLVSPAATVEQIVFALQLAGYRVIYAHPERMRYVQEDPNALIPLIERGTLMQLTADALLGAQGERMRRFAEVLLSHRLVQLIASDAHGPHFDRMPNLGAARDRAATQLGAP